ncbi:MAG: alpha-amylase family glycosyl hydrolase, partial [Candidatus Izemoplasmataceae bacterium]
ALVGQEHYLNGPHIHKILRHLNRDIFKKYGTITVGETVFITPNDAVLYVAPERKELDMVFHFEHMGVDNHLKWFLRKFKPHKLKTILYKWQLVLENQGLNALYFENHDQPRSVSRFGDDQSFHKESAKMLATLLFTLKGIPYIYQGQEIGMTNAYFDDLNDYKDIETHSVYSLGRKTLKLSHNRMMKKIKYMSRDNARTPMQWSKASQAGFTKGSPWIKVNPNHQEINVEESGKDQDSIMNYYRKLIRLRKEEPTFVFGVFTPYLVKHKLLYVFTRTHKEDTLLVIVNHSSKSVRLKLPNALDFDFHCLVNTNENNAFNKSICLTPYQSIILKRMLKTKK